VSVWFAIPSKRPPEECDPVLKLWAERGYQIALWRDWNDARRWPQPEGCCFVRTAEKYPGYAIAVNSLVKQILETDKEAEWIVTGGDDIEPDPDHTAEQIAEECGEYFVNPHPRTFNDGTFGVMQPTGDRWGEDDPFARQRWPEAPAYIDRVCGSPWMGREFCRRMYQGNGPLWPGYRHMFEDEELQNVAQRLGVLWQRRDITHYHQHWSRGNDKAQMPEFLREVSGQAHWAEAKAMFETRKAGGFPGHEPIA
jgi:hypothetical protein